MGKNYIYKVVWIVLITMAILISLYWLPDIKIGNFELKKIDLLSDMRPDGDYGAQEEDLNVAAKNDKEKEAAYADSCKAGMTCIDDYSSDDAHGMAPYYDALDKMKSLGRPVRIAVLGDSYIEGDIVTGELRDMLQKRYGGNGAGFVSMTSEVAGFRRTVRHTFGGWQSFSAVDHGGFKSDQQFISGRYFNGGPGSWIELAGQSSYCTHLDTCDESSIFFKAKTYGTVTATINGGQTQTFNVSASDQLQKLTVKGRIGRVKWTGCAGTFYGATMDGKNGIVVDNYSLRGCSGTNLNGMTDEMLQEIDKLRHYDLIIMEYGLNVANNKMKNYDYYKKPMDQVIAKLKRCCPNSGILILSVSDRDHRENGEFHTIKGLEKLVQCQQDMAADAGIAYWNLFQAMGGEGSMARMVNAKPSMANLDYTHLNFRGGMHIATLLYDALVWGKMQNERWKQYENSKKK
jgi:lysophospholipase L1-like esterase